MSTPITSSTRAGSTDLADLTIAEAAGLLRRRGVSSLELVEEMLRKIEETESLVHAYCLVFADEARRQAKQVDRDLAHGHWLGCLHGIPVGIKDLINVKGAPTESGSRVLTGYAPAFDATVVSRLNDAGAIAIGKTVTHEFGYGVNTPPTRNPWNLSCYPGGSSAGSGVAVSVRSAYGALGTDTGGSIRVPASMNNLVGLKPTFGRVSRYGISALSSSLDHAGPITRTVQDCAVMLQAVAGYDPKDTGSIDCAVPDYLAEIDRGVQNAVIGVDRRYAFYDGVSTDVLAATEEVLAEFTRQGAIVIDVSIPELDVVTTAVLTILLAEASAVHRDWIRTRAHDYDPATRIMLELGELLPGTHYVMAQQVRHVVRDAVKNTFRAYELDALFSPTLPITTVPIEELSVARETNEAPMQSLLHHTPVGNLTGLPALTAPCGFDRTGLPIGYQLIGRPFEEATLISVAHAYEKNHEWETMKPELVPVKE
jgi:aspartyl-tRNA(Asn)/glutamyl-tRNA(Gln) amidotransferase subunit A